MTAKLHLRLALAIRDKNIAQMHSEELKKLGFAILKVTPRGVSFEGRHELIEKVFNTEIIFSEASIQFKKGPKIPGSISQHVDSIYIPSKPTFFKK